MVLSLPTGIPMDRELDKNLMLIKPVQFCGDEEAVGKDTEAVATRARPTSEGEWADYFPKDAPPPPIPFSAPVTLTTSVGLFSFSCR